MTSSRPASAFIRDVVAHGLLLQSLPACRLRHSMLDQGGEVVFFVPIRAMLLLLPKRDPPCLVIVIVTKPHRERVCTPPDQGQMLSVEPLLVRGGTAVILAKTFILV